MPDLEPAEFVPRLPTGPRLSTGPTASAPTASAPIGKFVSYLRKSDPDDPSGDASLELQRACILRYLTGDEWSSIREYAEAEYGRKWRLRPKLAEAIELCREHSAVILIVDEESSIFSSLMAQLERCGIPYVAVPRLQR